MQNVLLLQKPVSLTPLQVIEQFKIVHPEYKNEKLGYAGRLDPMAEGLMLVLVGEENKKRKEYEALPKTYEFSVLFGVATDTYDVMGILERDSGVATLRRMTIEEKIKALLPTYLGKKKQPYPPYSSRTVKGKPLYYWARIGKLAEIVIPTKEIEIYELTMLGSEVIEAQTLYTTIIDRITNVQGDFRQEEILENWKKFFHAQPLGLKRKFSVAHFSVSCSSGTYVRSLANQLGKDLGGSSLAFAIKRVKIGDYIISSEHILPTI